MSQRKDTGLNTNPWPKLVDHYNCSTLALSPVLGRNEKDNLASINNSLNSANDLLADLNEVTRIESGKISPTIEPASLHEIFSSLGQEFAPMVNQYQMQFSWFKTRYCVATDKKLLRRILQNLLTNAFRYASPGKVLLGCRKVGNSIDIQVIDNGPGIEKSEQQLIFKQFTQLNNKNQKGAKGLGLGLNIAQSLAALLESNLQLSSTPGSGSLFSFKLPIHQAPIEKTSQQTVEASITLAGVTVLCIDNEPEVLTGMEKLLTAWGCHVVTASNSAQATAQFKQPQYQFDIILADYHLDNNENGISLINTLQQVNSYPVPAILITATTDSEVLEQCQELGIGYLRKLIKPVALRALMSSMLAKALQQNYTSKL